MRLFLDLCLQTASACILKRLCAAVSTRQDAVVSTAPEEVAVKFWTPNLGARVPTDLSTGIPDYSEYLQSGLWRHRRRLRVVSGTGDDVAYQQDGAREWPTSLPTAILQVCESRRQMLGAGREQYYDPDVVMHCLEGQVALLHHIMAFEDANHGRIVAYFLGAVTQSQLTLLLPGHRHCTQSQLTLLERTTIDTAGVAYTSSNSWVVSTSKKLSWELRHNANRSLGCVSDAQFESLPALQAFKWAPMKILAFLWSNSKSRFAVHIQLRELMFGQWMSTAP